MLQKGESHGHPGNWVPACTLFVQAEGGSILVAEGVCAHGHVASQVAHGAVPCREDLGLVEGGRARVVVPGLRHHVQEGQLLDAVLGVLCAAELICLHAHAREVVLQSHNVRMQEPVQAAVPRIPGRVGAHGRAGQVQALGPVEVVLVRHRVGAALREVQRAEAVHGMLLLAAGLGKLDGRNGQVRGRGAGGRAPASAVPSELRVALLPHALGKGRAAEHADTPVVVQGDDAVGTVGGHRRNVGVGGAFLGSRGVLHAHPVRMEGDL
mmetsp:Transcript_51800/g.150441  ORF Transcript_51800/g.150441 Transcript_51800/m.150441 type:complete len:267 (-) Transcript_51800:400-1200(-)